VASSRQIHQLRIVPRSLSKDYFKITDAGVHTLSAGLLQRS